MSRLQPQVHFFHLWFSLPLKCLKHFRPRTDLLLHGYFFAQDPINDCDSQSVSYRMTQRHCSYIFHRKKYWNLSPRILGEIFMLNLRFTSLQYFDLLFAKNEPFLSLITITMCDLQKLWKDDEPSLKFIYSEKATKFCEISTLLLTGTT